ncbi:hypothetical protein [Thiohalophilus sp.]|uniref:hypothetical protein n=1 Tax=Thiohalophilus sp. TaxID=3028392 RepID=UPI002ACEFD1D|nr:hypothetical protein [Thiohalophilus sp.]MDZ7661469.1 hypothetical protein [Thiohalophilus sp.]
MSDFIRINGLPTDHAEKAYKEGYYLEALQTLHGWLECKLRELLLMQRTTNDTPHDSWASAWDASNEFSLNNAAKTLFVIGVITESEYSRIKKFNRLRNNLVHKIFYDPYNESWKGVPHHEIEEAFKSGMLLSEEIEFKSGEVLESQNTSNK